jgi:hypothetical protein
VWLPNGDQVLFSSTNHYWHAFWSPYIAGAALMNTGRCICAELGSQTEIGLMYFVRISV